MKVRFAPAAMSAAMAAVCLLPRTAGATLIDGARFASLALPPGSFGAADDGVVNPVQTFTGVPGYGALTVSYAPYFLGQSASSFFSPPTGVSGAPVGLLTLDAGPGPTADTSYQTVIEFDATTGQEELGGAPAGAQAFVGPVAILFSRPIAGITLNAGSFDSVGLTSFEAFDANGASLGSVVNQAVGEETFNLRDDAGALISGLLITTSDPGGFGIGESGIATPPPAIPTPGAAAVVPALLVLLRLARRRR